MQGPTPLSSGWPDAVVAVGAAAAVGAVAAVAAAVAAGGEGPGGGLAAAANGLAGIGAVRRLLPARRGPGRGRNP